MHEDKEEAQKTKSTKAPSKCTKKKKSKVKKHENMHKKKGRIEMHTKGLEVQECENMHKKERAHNNENKNLSLDINSMGYSKKCGGPHELFKK
jgi:hypothetical protein